MQSKISYFKGRGNRIINPGVWWKDILSFWPLWTVELLLLQVVTALPLTNEMNIILRENDTEAGGLETRRLFHIAVSTGSYVVLIAVLSILAAVFVFGYLNNSRSAYMLHSLPINRGTYFTTHFLSGLAMLFVPFAVTYGILWGIGIRYHLGMSAVVFGNLITTFLVILFFYSLACMVVMLSGNGIMSLVVYGILNVLEIGFRMLLQVVSEQFLYAGTFDLETITLDRVCTPILGFATLFRDKIQYMTVSSRVLPGVMAQGLWGGYFTGYEDSLGIQSLKAVDWKSLGFCLLSLVVSAVFLLLAFQMYQKRPLERVGDLVAFTWCKPIFKAVFCACGSLLCVCLFSVLFSGRIAGITYENQRFVCIGFMLFGCVISYLTGDMILAKSFSIWKRLSWVQMGIFCGVMLIVLGVNYFWGYNRQLSTGNAEQADYVSFQLGSISFLYTKEEYKKLGLEEIRQDIVREGQKLTPVDAENDVTMFVRYEYIKEGVYQKTSRYYYINEGKQQELLDSLKDAIDKTDNMAAAVFTEAYESAKCVDMEVRKGEDDDDHYYIEDNNARERVFQALLKDLEEGKFPVENWDVYSRFEEDGIEMYCQIEISEGKLKQIGLPEELWWEYNGSDFTVAVTEEMEHTWKEVQQALKEAQGLKKPETSEAIGEKCPAE